MTLVDLLLIELMLHLSHVNQVYSQPIHLTHELILCILITRRRIHFNGDSTAKCPCWHRVLVLVTFQPISSTLTWSLPLQNTHNSTNWWTFRWTCNRCKVHRKAVDQLNFRSITPRAKKNLIKIVFFTHVKLTLKAFGLIKIDQDIFSLSTHWREAQTGIILLLCCFLSARPRVEVEKAQVEPKLSKLSSGRALARYAWPSSQSFIFLVKRTNWQSVAGLWAYSEHFRIRLGPGFSIWA